MSNARRFTKGIAATLVSQLITAGGQLAMVPIFLSHWGDQLYGEWLTLYAAIAYMTVVDFGMQMYVVNRLNQAFTNGDMKDYHQTLHSAFMLSLTVACSAVALIIAFFAIAPIAEWFEFSIIEQQTAAIIGTLLGVQLVGAVPHGMIVGIYRTIGEYHRGVMVGNVQRLMLYVFTAAAVVLGYGPITVAAAQLTPLALVVLYVWTDLRRRHPQIQLGFRQGTYAQAKAFLGPSFFFFLLQLSTGLIVQGTTLVVSGVLGAAAVVLFVTNRTLANLVTQITGIVNSTLWPDLTALEAQGRYDTLRELQQLATKVVMGLTIAASIFLLFNGELILQLWTRGKVPYDALLMTALVAYLLYLAFVNTSGMVLVASNRHRKLAILAVLATGAGVGLAVPAAHWIGVSGVVAAMLLGDMVFKGVAQVRDACRVIQQPVIPFTLRIVGRGGAVAAASYAAIWGFHEAVGPNSVGAMIASGLLTGVVVGGLSFTLWLNRPERRRVMSVARLGR